MSQQQTVLVTGGASGIGFAIVKAVLAEGWRAVVADLDLFEEAVVAVDGDVRLLALGGLDLDVAGGYADLELERQRSMEAALQHLRGTPRCGA